MSYTNRTLLAIVGAVALMASGAAQTSTPRTEAFTANAINMSGFGSSMPTSIDIIITHWTTVAEQERYISVLRGRGGDALAEALRKGPSVGSIRTPGSLAYEFRYAIQERTRNNLRRIVLVTDRPMEFAEVASRPLSAEYPFSAIELLVDDSGRGKGSLWVAAKLTLLDDLLLVDNYADRPIDLKDVRPKTDRLP